MSQTSTVKEVEATKTKIQALSLLLPDAASTSHVVLTQALEYCAQKMGLASAQEAVERVNDGNPAACGYCHYSVAKQVAEALGALDQNVRSAYVFDYDATPQDLCFGESVQATPVHLLVWTDRKTRALNSLVEALDQALAEQLRNILGRGARAHVLDVQIVDSADIESRTGYGALLSSLHNRPVKVWER